MNDMDKQIKEIAIVINDCPFIQAPIGCNKYDGSVEIAKYLYNEGWCKQSDNLIEVIRCKDCFFGDVDTTGSGRVQCQNRDVPWRRYKEEFTMRPHDYCSYARAKMKGGAE